MYSSLSAVTAGDGHSIYQRSNFTLLCSLCTLLANRKICSLHGQSVMFPLCHLPNEPLIPFRKGILRCVHIAPY